MKLAAVKQRMSRYSKSKREELTSAWVEYKKDGLGCQGEMHPCPPPLFDLQEA
jgi:hypothetical protein